MHIDFVMCKNSGIRAIIMNGVECIALRKNLVCRRKKERLRNQSFKPTVACPFGNKNDTVACDGEIISRKGTTSAQESRL